MGLDVNIPNMAIASCASNRPQHHQYDCKIYLKHVTYSCSSHIMSVREQCPSDVRAAIQSPYLHAEDSRVKNSYTSSKGGDRRKNLQVPLSMACAAGCTTAANSLRKSRGRMPPKFWEDPRSSRTSQHILWYIESKTQRRIYFWDPAMGSGPKCQSRSRGLIILT